MSCGYDLEAFIGETFTLDITYKDGNGDPIDIAADLVTWTVDGMSYTSTGAQEVVIGGGTGQIRLMLTTDQVEDLGIGIFDYSLVLSDAFLPVGEGDTILISGVMQVE